jgi:hypothetical protein
VADINANDADLDADAFDDSAADAHDLTTPAPVASATTATAMPSATSVIETASIAETPVASASASATTAMTAASMATTSTIAATTLPVPTPEQLAHLYAVRDCLAPKERAIAERAIARMDPPLLVHWLTELSSMSVADATSKIRGLIAQIPTRKP